ncbi:serine protease [Variovorax sp. H27-G14]|uniref:S1 family peptidase n=1 Tax=Variovorax sp. H27-G14 TaxID=3111914 RepID=UPI0038FD3394
MRTLPAALAAALIAAVSASTAMAQGTAPLAPDALFARVAPSVWVVQASDAQGKVLATGSAVATGPGTAVTRCQVLAKASAVSLKRDNVSYGATLEFPDTERGLCQLRIANLQTPAIAMVPASALQVGMPLYIVGAPRGRELTLGIGMLAGVRRSATGELEALQLASAPEPGLEGAGLFDAQGRLAGLVGLVATAPAEPAAANLAAPAAWIAELPGRGRLAVERMPAQPATASLSSPIRPSVIEYRLHDRLTNTYRNVIYRADAATAPDDRLSFNNGGWIEKPGGEVISVASPIAGEFDTAMPPGGWAKENLEGKRAWKTKYGSVLGGMRVNMDLDATATQGTTLSVAGKDYGVVRIQYRGFTQRYPDSGALSSNQYGPYEATVWFSPALGRVVRFEVETRGGVLASGFHVRETLELVSVR